MKKTLLFMICAMLTSCASIIGSKSERVAIASNVEGTKITITDADLFPVHSSTLPAMVRLDKKDGYFTGQSYTITAEKEGYRKEMQTLDTTLSGWYFGNILFGGLIGMLIVDPLTGAMWTFEDDRVFFSMQKVEG